MSVNSIDYEVFKERLRDTIGLDLNRYKQQQMQRRIKQWLARVGVSTYEEYLQLLQTDGAERSRFTEYLTINTSQFYRDKAVFQQIEESVLPGLLRRFRRLRIWSAGCSIGAEIYTIAMILQELSGDRRHTLIGTDFDVGALSKARAGVYAEDLLANLPSRYVKKYFSRQGKFWQITDEIRQQVRFRKHNLLEDPFDTGFHLILCRNVFIYFTPETQAALTEQFARSLVAGGIFVIGSAENVMSPEKAHLKRISYCIYEKY